MNALSLSNEITSSAMGMNCRLYVEMLTSPSTPSSSKIRLTSVDSRGTSRMVYVWDCPSRPCRLIWSARIQKHEIDTVSDCESKHTSHYLDPLNPWSTQVYDIRRGGRERSRLQPEHLVYPMVLYVDRYLPHLIYMFEVLVPLVRPPP